MSFIVDSKQNLWIVAFRLLGESIYAKNDVGEVLSE